jgi:hypothetical protein
MFNPLRILCKPLCAVSLLFAVLFLTAISKHLTGPEEVPEHEYLEEYAAEFRFFPGATGRKDCNDETHVQSILDKAIKTLRAIGGRLWGQGPSESKVVIPPKEEAASFVEEVTSGNTHTGTASHQALGDDNLPSSTAARSCMDHSPSHSPRESMHDTAAFNSPSTARTTSRDTPPHSLGSVSEATSSPPSCGAAQTHQNRRTELSSKPHLVEHDARLIDDIPSTVEDNCGLESSQQTGTKRKREASSEL